MEKWKELENKHNVYLFEQLDYRTLFDRVMLWSDIAYSNFYFVNEVEDPDVENLYIQIAKDFFYHVLALEEKYGDPDHAKEMEAIFRDRFKDA